MHLPWEAELLKHPDLSSDQYQSTTLFRGLRTLMGCAIGDAMDMQPCMRTGRAEYFGPVLNEAARVASVAHGGQVTTRSKSPYVDSAFIIWATMLVCYKLM